jgi:CRP-like cAMP-binding protein
MKKYLPILFRSYLFEGIAPMEIEKLLDCLSARTKKFEKDEYIFMEGDEISAVGLVLSGAVHVVQDDFWGNRAIVARMGPGELFAEAFSCGGIEKLPVSVMAAEKAEILLINFKKIITVCPSACGFHTKLVSNMIGDLARKNIRLMKKMEHITRRSTRDKLLSYLGARARQAKGNAFQIPFNREELADYLSVDRSAMSAELCRMRDEGILSFHKNNFELLKQGKAKAALTGR